MPWIGGGEMTISEKAYAKVNLFLDVTGRREDGYHNVDTLMCSVSLCDTIKVKNSPSDKIIISICCNDQNIPTDENNLIYKAALKYLSLFEINDCLTIDLNKRIPVGAGLGGGSSDAAATLRALNRIYKRATKSRLLEMAAELGSDVPFCIDGLSAFCSGRGEILRPTKIKKASNIVIAIGESRVSTPKAYAMLDERFNCFKDVDTAKGSSDKDVFSYYNIFESVIRLDEIEKIKKIMKDNGSEHSLMSGSGPAVFGFFSNCIGAYRTVGALKKEGFLAFKCRMI